MWDKYKVIIVSFGVPMLCGAIWGGVYLNDQRQKSVKSHVTNTPIVLVKEMPDSLKNKAIELAKECVITVYTGEELTMREFITITSKASLIFFIEGWSAVDVSESMCFVIFKFKVGDEDKDYCFHVIPQDNIVQQVEDANAYITNLLGVSTYPEERIRRNILKILPDKKSM